MNRVCSYLMNAVDQLCVLRNDEGRAGHSDAAELIEHLMKETERVLSNLGLGEFDYNRARFT